MRARPSRSSSRGPGGRRSSRSSGTHDGPLRLVAVGAVLELREVEREMRAAIPLSGVGDPCAWAHPWCRVAPFESVAVRKGGRGSAPVRRDRRVRFGWPGARGVGPRPESTRSPARRRPGSRRAPPAVGRPGPRRGALMRIVEPLAAGDTESRAIGPAQRRDRLRELDGLAQERLQLQLVMIRQANHVGLDGEVDGVARGKVEAREGLLLHRQPEGRDGRPEAPRAGSIDGGREARPNEHAAVRAADAHVTVDRLGEAESVVQSDGQPGEDIGAFRARWLAEQARQRVAEGPVPRHRYAGPSSSPTPSSGVGRSPAG